MQQRSAPGTNKAIFFIFLLLSGEVHAGRCRSRVDLAETQADLQTNEFDASSDGVIESDAEILGNPEDPGFLEKLGYYGALSKERRAFLRKKVPDEMLREALVYTVCIRVEPAGHKNFKGYGLNSTFEVQCSENFEMVRAGSDDSEMEWLSGVIETMRIPQKRNEDEDAFVKSEFRKWEDTHQVFPRQLSIRPNNDQHKWPPYKPKMQNRFMICFGNVFETRSWEDCTGFWSHSLVLILLDDLVRKFSEEKRTERLLDEIRAKALYPGSSSVDAMVVGKRVSQKATYKLGIVDMVVPLVRKTLNRANLEIDRDVAKGLGLDVRPLEEYTSKAGVEGLAPFFRSTKSLVSIFADIIGKKAAPMESDHCIAPESNAVGACQVLCNTMVGCEGFNFHSKTNACCFFEESDEDEMQVKVSRGTTWFLKPHSDGGSLVETKTEVTEPVAVACTAGGGGGGGGAAALTIGGIAVPPVLVAVGALVIAVLAFKVLRRWVRSKKLSSKLTKFAKLMSPKFSIVTIEDSEDEDLNEPWIKDEEPDFGEDEEDEEEDEEDEIDPPKYQYPPSYAEDVSEDGHFVDVDVTRPQGISKADWDLI